MYHGQAGTRTAAMIFPIRVARCLACALCSLLLPFPLPSLQIHRDPTNQNMSLTKLLAVGPVCLVASQSICLLDEETTDTHNRKLTSP